MRCEKDNKKGWKWGESGTCYIGAKARERALDQGRAIQASKNAKK